MVWQVIIQMFDDLVKLISEEYTFDEIGRQISQRTEKEVFARVESVSRSEFFNAGQAGLKPEYKVTVWTDEYGGELLVEYNEVVYAVYRTYLDKDRTELYLRRKEGTANG